MKHLKQKLSYYDKKTKLVPQTTRILRQSRQFSHEMNNIFNSLKEIKQFKKYDPVNLKFTIYQRSLNGFYRGLCSKKKKWSDQFMMYNSLLCNPNNQENDIIYIYKRLFFKYGQHLMKRQNIGFLISHLIVRKIIFPQFSQKLSEITKIFYKASQTHRQTIDCSKYVFLLLRDRVDDWTDYYKLASTPWIGRSEFQQTCKQFQDFFYQQKKFIMEAWNQLQLSEYQIIKVINYILDFKNIASTIQKNNNLYSLLFLIKLIIQRQSIFPFSAQFLQSFQKMTQKIIYLQISKKTQLFTVNLMIFKLFLDNKQELKFLKNIQQIITLLYLSYRITSNHYHQISSALHDKDFQQYSQIIQQQINKIDKYKQDEVASKILSKNFTFTQKKTQIQQQHQSRKQVFNLLFKRNQKGLIHNNTQIPTISSLSKLYYNRSSYKKDKKPNQSKNKSHPWINPKQRDQMFLYIDQKLDKNQYIQILWILWSVIRRQYDLKIQFYTDNLQSTYAAEKVKQAENLYLRMLIKILQHIMSPQNHFLVNGLMDMEFIKILYKFIIQDLIYRKITTTNFQFIFKDLYRNSTTMRILYFDINQHDFALEKIIDSIKKQHIHTCSPSFYYEFSIIQKLYNQIKGCKDQSNQLSSLITKQTKNVFQSLLSKQYHLNLLTKFKIYGIKPDSIPLRKKIKQLYDIQQSNQQYKYRYKQNSINLEFIKCQCLKLLNILSRVNKLFFFDEVQRNFHKYEKNYFSKKILYYDIFSCLIIALNDQAILSDIYANLLYECLSSKHIEMKNQVYEDHFNTLFQICEFQLKRQKASSSYKEIQSIKWYVCTFDKMRQVEIRKKYQQENKDSSRNLMFQPGSKAKACTQPRHAQSQFQQKTQIYSQYLQKIFNFSYSKILSFGYVLYQVHKYKQSIFILQILRQNIKKYQTYLKENHLKTQKINLLKYNHFENQIDAKNENIEEIIKKIKEVLSNSYGKISTSFRYYKSTVEKITSSQKSEYKYQKLPSQYKVDVDQIQEKDMFVYNQVQDKIKYFKLNSQQIPINYMMYDQINDPYHYYNPQDSKYFKKPNYTLQSPFQHESFISIISKNLTNNLNKLYDLIVTNNDQLSLKCLARIYYQPNHLDQKNQKKQKQIIDKQFKKIDQIKYQQLFTNQKDLLNRLYGAITKFISSHITRIQSYQALEAMYQDVMLAAHMIACYQQGIQHMVETYIFLKLQNKMCVQFMPSQLPQQSSQLNQMKQIINKNQSASLKQINQLLLNLHTSSNSSKISQKNQSQFIQNIPLSNNKMQQNNIFYLRTDAYFMPQITYLLKLLSKQGYSLTDNLYQKRNKFHILWFLKCIDSKKIIEYNLYNTSLQINRQFYYNISQIQTPKFLFDYLLNKYTTISYRLMSLFELQMLQNYYFQTKSFKKVKIIIPIMKAQKRNHNLNYEQIKYINWPQVYENQLFSKINDLSISFSNFPTIAEMIEEQFQIMFRQIPDHQENEQQIQIILQEEINKKKIYNQIQKSQRKKELIKKRIEQYLNRLKNNQSEKYQKFCILHTQKIKNYLKFYRIVFDQLNLKQSQGINIFHRLFEFYDKLFLCQADAIKKELKQQFFLYFFRFLVEKIDPKFLKNKEDEQKLDEQKQDEQKLDQQILIFLKNNMQYAKKHILYILRSLDPNPHNKANQIIIKFLVQLFSTLGHQFCWQLLYIKYYENTSFRKQSSVNQKYNQVIHYLYKEIQKRLGQQKVNQIIKIPKIIRDWPQKTQLQRDYQTTIEMQNQKFVQDEIAKINKALAQSKYKVPYPFDSNFFIEKVLQVKITGDGKSKPFFISFSCGYYPEWQEFIKNKKMSKQKKQQKSQQQKNQKKQSIKSKKKSPQQQISQNPLPKSQVKNSSTFLNNSKQPQNRFKTQKIQQIDKKNTPKHYKKRCIAKYNFSVIDHRIQPNSANFYKDISILNPQTTYQIKNLGKYTLLIQQITVPLQTLNHRVSRSIGIKQNQRPKIEIKKREFLTINQQLNDYNKTASTKWFQKVKQKDKETLQKQNYPSFNSMFNSFYTQGIKSLYSIHRWWEYINNYTRTLAYWSFLCLATKLGDRHKENIFISNKGQFIHIDLQMNFGVGFNLPVPQQVPFRLNDILVSPLGVFKQNGLFFCYFLKIAKLFDLKKQQIWKALIHFTPDQKKIIQKSIQFRNLPQEQFIKQCRKFISQALDQKILRSMYTWWEPQL